jgi:hypothetical protein
MLADFSLRRPRLMRERAHHHRPPLNPERNRADAIARLQLIRPPPRAAEAPQTHTPAAARPVRRFQTPSFHHRACAAVSATKSEGLPPGVNLGSERAPYVPSRATRWSRR